MNWLKLIVIASLFMLISACQVGLAPESWLNQLGDKFGQSIESGSIVWSFGLALAAGFLSALTPCVYPLIPITLTVMGVSHQRNRWHGLSLTLSYGAGIVTLFVFLGLTSGLLGQLWGGLLRQPGVLIVIALFSFWMALVSFGLFSFRLPQAIHRLHHSRTKGRFRSFALGFFAGVVATPCIGPVLAVILTLLAQRGSLAFGALLMFVYAIGFATPLFALGTFSSLINRVPKSGKWMAIVKGVLGIAMVGVGLFYLNLAFSESKKGGKQEAVANSLIWQAIGARNTAFDDLQSLLSHAKQTNKAVLLDFYADWCTACVQLNKITFVNPLIVEALKDYILIKIDLTIEHPQLEQIQDYYRVPGLPTLLLVNTQGVLTKRIYGFVPAEILLNDLK